MTFNFRVKKNKKNLTLRYKKKKIHKVRSLKGGETNGDRNDACGSSPSPTAKRTYTLIFVPKEVLTTSETSQFQCNTIFIKMVGFLTRQTPKKSAAAAATQLSRQSTSTPFASSNKNVTALCCFYPHLFRYYS